MLPLRGGQKVGGQMVFMLIHALLALVACTNSGLDQPTPTGDTAPTTAAGDCPWVGTWALQGVNCSASFPYEAWYDTYNSAAMGMSHGAEGGCDVVFTLVGDNCTQTEAWHFASPVGTSVEARYDGVTDCNPNACEFVAGSVSCSRNDRAGIDETLVVDESNGTMTAVDLIGHTAPGCTLDVVTSWERQ